LARDDSWCRSLSGQSIGKFVLVEFIGAGKIGYVYRALRRDLPGDDFPWAVKLTFDTLKLGWEVELRKIGKLRLIDGVVHFHDLGAVTVTHENVSRLAQYTVWDYIPPGENLKQYLKRVRSVSTSFLHAVVEQVLRVRHACEKQGVPRHGDLHSGNILIGDPSPARLDDTLQPHAPIYVSDFGYGTTGAVTQPKDDYAGLAHIVNEMLEHVDYARASATDRQILKATQLALTKLLREPTMAERRPPLELLHALSEIKRSAQAGGQRPPNLGVPAGMDTAPGPPVETPNVGSFQVTEMIGDRWEWWKRLFVPTVPARSKILALDIPTVVTGPRGCGKTMLFRWLRERLVVECGEVADLPISGRFVAFYVNANDIADAFAHFPEQPAADDEARLTCYANLCVLADLLAVQSARMGKLAERATDALLLHVQRWLVPDTYATLLDGKDRLERYRTILEQIKWKLPSRVTNGFFPGYADLSQHRWLPHFLQQASEFCPWIKGRPVLLFIDDYSTPRVSPSMQGILNRLFLQRSPHFLAKLATEASSTFVPEDSSGKNLEDGDDYQLVDMGEESLFLLESERLAFLNDVFSRRLEADQRIPRDRCSLHALLGRMGVSKTEFARRLRTSPHTQSLDEQAAVSGGSQRRGRSRARVLYWGEDVFSSLWSGDTRTMIQLITDVVDQASEAVQRAPKTNQIKLPIDGGRQDRVFRNRGGQWLSSHERNAPTQPDRVNEGLARLQELDPQYQLCGVYGEHLKAVVETFVAAARKLLLGPTYTIREGKAPGEVPRMAFRLEIVDEFRIDGLAREIYRDLVRYGLFIRDSRGKSVGGTFVPRLFLRRLLLPYSALALSKRDSVPLPCEELKSLLLKPDAFKASFTPPSAGGGTSGRQLPLSFLEAPSVEIADTAYDDLDDGDESDLPPGHGVDGHESNETGDAEEEL
jgi:hypothetical protein